MRKIIDIMQISPVIPVANIADSDRAVDLAQALLAGGVGVIEVTLRTPAALQAIKNISKQVPKMCVGVGTAWTAEQVAQAVDAGAQFIVSPGRSDAVWESCTAHQVPLLPGTQTASEIAVWVRRGLPAVKFFPAEVAGGVPALKAFSAVFPDLLFCPTGGINANSAPDYLKLATVPCVGGSWLLDKAAIQNGQWDKIEALAAACASL